MTSSKEQRCICIQCERSVRFCASNVNEKRRHVAIVHSREIFSTFRCAKCQRKYFDWDHFTEHVEEFPECRVEYYMVIPEPLSPELEMAFDALVSQMMRAINENPTESGQTTKTSIRTRGINRNGQFGGTSWEITKRSCVTSSTDGIKGEHAGIGKPNSRMNGIKEESIDDKYAAKPNSTNRRTGAVTRAMTGIHKRKPIEDECADIDIKRIGNNGGSGKGRKGLKNSAIGNMLAKNNRSKMFNDRQKYIHDLISGYSERSDIACRLCAMKLPLTNHVLWMKEHALIHLNKDVYQCKLCNTHAKSYYKMKEHTASHHQGKVAGLYIDKMDQYHQEIMDMLDRCFDGGSGNGVVKSKKKSRSSIDGETGQCGNGKIVAKITTGGAAYGKVFQCRFCQFQTKHEMLMKKHSKVIHGR